MEFIKKIADEKFSLGLSRLTQKNRFANPLIVKQFLLGDRQDSLQITLIEKSNLYQSQQR